MRRLPPAAALAALAAAALAGGCRREAPAGGTFRLGYFRSVTHAQALVGVEDGTFARALPGGLETRVFDAGPAAVEALAVGDLDATYVGAGPAVIAYLRTGGELRVVAGAASGGAALVVRDARGPEDLAGAKVASPAVGNTQDVALRTWLRARGLSDDGGRRGVQVLPLSGADVLSLFARGELAGAWVPEPWAARLVAQGARILVDERSLWEDGAFPTAVLAVSRRALERRRAEVLALVRAHLELTARARRDPLAFAQAANAAFGRLAGKPLADGVLRDAFSRLELTADPLPRQLQVEARNAQALGYAPGGDSSGMVDRSLLDEIARR